MAPRMTPEQRSARARIANLRRHRPGDPATGEAQRDLRASRLEDHVREVVAQAPPLTAEQAERIRALLPCDPPTGAA